MLIRQQGSLDITDHLDELDDRPELTIAIGGREYHFSEVPISGLADCQEFLRKTVAHPVQAIRPHLSGLSDADRQALLNQARLDAQGWPPQAGTAAGMSAMLATEEGQVRSLKAGLDVHHPGLGAEEVRRVYKVLQREAVVQARRDRRAGKDTDGEGIVNRVYSVIFGFGDPAVRDDEPLPEA